jgi:hypothetical protein
MKLEGKLYVENKRPSSKFIKVNYLKKFKFYFTYKKNDKSSKK